MTAPREWTIEVAGVEPLSLNDRDSRYARARRVADWREQVGWLAKAQRIPRLDRVHVAMTFRPPNNNRRDADNLVATLKPVLDGLVDAGVVADDNPDHVTWDPPAIGRAYTGYSWRYTIRVRAVEGV